jgi:hypothetical protein
MPRCIYVSHRPSRFRRRAAGSHRTASGPRRQPTGARAADGGSPNDQSSHRGHLPGWKGGKQRRLRVRGSNIVAGDTNELPNVFVVDRAPGYSIDASPCRNGTTLIASRGLGGAANGGSYGPAISGEPSSDRGRGEAALRCVAFVSEASNPVAGATNGRPDAFVYWLGSGEVRRGRVASDRWQSDGSTSDLAVSDGSCTRVDFTSDPTNLAQTTSEGKADLDYQANYKGVRTAAAPGEVKQIYARIIGSAKKRDHGLVSLTSLASAFDASVPGNGDARSPSGSLRTVAFVVARTGA